MIIKKHLRWGLLSTARINQAVIKPIRLSNRSRLVAVASRSKNKAEEYARNWEIPRYYASYDALLEDPEVDVIYISLPNSLHAEWSIKAMRMGKHVLCEKPIATSTKSIDEVISTANETRMVITEAFMYRHHPQTKFVKSLVDGGQIGQLRFIRGAFCYTNTRQNDIRFDSGLGGGSLWDVGCYPISYARYVIADEPIEVYGHQLIGPTGIDLQFAGQMIFPNDVMVQFECGFITPFSTLIEITGERGKITIPVPYKPGEKEKIQIESNGSKEIIRIKGAKLYSGEINDIEDAILSGKPPLITLADSRGNIAAIEALYQSTSVSNALQIAQ